MNVDPRCPEMRQNRRRAVPKTPAPTQQMALKFGRPMKRTAANVVSEHLLGVLPTGVPPGFTSIDSAEFRGAGRKRTAVAVLTMIDGLKSTVEVFGWGAGCAGHRWLAWEGDDLSFEDGRWQRVRDDVEIAA